MTDERIEQVFDTGPQAQVSVENVHGAVVVEAWDQPQVHVVAVRRGESARVILEGEGQWVSAHTEIDREMGIFGWGKETTAEVEYTLRVPRETRLTAKTVKGPVQVSGRTCPECGHPTLIRRDGCDFCTSCGHVGACG